VPRNRIVFWLGEPSPHQSSYLRALADLLPEKTIVGVFEQNLEKERLALGWRAPSLGRMETVMSPDRRTIGEIALCEPENTVHIFGGLRLPMVNRALGICAPTTALIGVLSEARHLHGWSGRLRLLHSYFVERPYRSRVDFVLAIGHLGVRWYEICGYPSERIFPWGYFVEKEGFETIQRSQEGRFRDLVIAFVGQCIPRKGIDTLLRALSTLRLQEWCLSIIGDGPQRPRLERLAAKLGVAKRVAFMGVMNNAEVRNILSDTDLLILPSRFDGWGSVINEALMSGVPVVCSDRCGAADLICATGYGETFQARSAEDLARVLHKWTRRGRLTNSLRSEIRAWSKCIEGEAVARYLVEIVAHVDDGTERPTAPWLRKRSTAYIRSDNNERLASHVRSNG
jgi:glycosyltransferase involved in cell wall biosynthesis